MDKKLSEMTDEELKDSYLSLYESIHIVECFGSRDIVELAAIEGELIKRGGSFICPECGKVIGTWRADGETWGFEPEIW